MANRDFVPGKLYVVTAYFREKNKENILWDSKNPKWSSKKHREGLGAYRSGPPGKRTYKEIACGEIVMWIGKGADPLERSDFSILYEDCIFHLTNHRLENLNKLLVLATPRIVAKHRR